MRTHENGWRISIWIWARAERLNRTALILDAQKSLHKLTFRVIQISADFRIGVVQYVDLLDQSRQKLVVIRLIFQIEFIATICLGLIIWIAGQTWIAESKRAIDLSEKEGEQMSLDSELDLPSIFQTVK